MSMKVYANSFGAPLSAVFATNAALQPELKWQYFLSGRGLHTEFPAHRSSEWHNPQHYWGPWCVTYSQHHMSAKKSHTISIWVGCYNELLFWYDSNVTLNSLILIWWDATLIFLYLYDSAVMCPGQTAAVKVMALWSGAAAVGGTSTCCNLRRGRMAGTCCCWSTWGAPSDRVP